MYHNPVLLKESVDALNINPNGIYVDVTFGGGGHSREILSRLDKGHLYAFDQDPDAQANVPQDDRFTLIDANFTHLKKFLRFHQVPAIDGLLADLGVSSHQFDVPERGFSIRFDAVMDMRMNTNGLLSAKDVLERYDESELVRIFGEYGEVHNSKSLARKILAARNEGTLECTVKGFKTLISSLTPPHKANQYLAQVFQALRIEVNDELEVLKNLLQQSAEMLKPEGRLSVISYHSLEDRLVKNFMMKGLYKGELPRDIYGHTPATPFKLVHRKPIEPEQEEIDINPRARSARLRVAERNGDWRPNS